MLSALLALSAIKHAHAVARLDFGGVGVSGANGEFDKKCAEEAVKVAKNIMVE